MLASDITLLLQGLGNLSINYIFIRVGLLTLILKVETKYMGVLGFGKSLWSRQKDQELAASDRSVWEGGGPNVELN